MIQCQEIFSIFDHIWRSFNNVASKQSISNKTPTFVYDGESGLTIHKQGEKYVIRESNGDFLLKATDNPVKVIKFIFKTIMHD